MKENLTARQESRLNDLLSFIQKKGYYPTFSELQYLWEVKSKNAVTDMIKIFERKGIVSRNDAGKIIKVSNPLRVLGQVQAGHPTTTEENTVEIETIDSYLIRRRNNSFLLKVNGDSMKDAGLVEGDIVVLEINTTPKNGDIVVARIENEWTIKYYYKINNKLELRPANLEFKSIYPETETVIIGVVVSSFRKF